MAKVVFIAFATEDVRMRNLLKDQFLPTTTQVEYVDFFVKEPSLLDWKDRVQIRVRRSDGVIVLVSANTLKSSGQKWEISCAKSERRRMLAVRAYIDDQTMPDSLSGIDIIRWSEQDIADFIDSL